MTLDKVRARAFGVALEWRAAMWLSLKGYRVIARNFQCVGGEIDIVALSPGRWLGRAQLCFVEVRGRATLEAAANSVHGHKQNRVRRAAVAFLAKHPRYAALERRFDIIAAGRVGMVRHLTDAFDP